MCIVIESISGVSQIKKGVATVGYKKHLNSVLSCIIAYHDFITQEFTIKQSKTWMSVSWKAVSFQVHEPRVTCFPKSYRSEKEYILFSMITFLFFQCICLNDESLFFSSYVMNKRELCISMFFPISYCLKNKLFKTYLYLMKPEKYVHILILLTMNDLDLELSEAWEILVFNSF